MLLWFFLIIFSSYKFRLSESLDDDSHVYSSSIPFCRQGHSQSVLKTYNNIPNGMNEKVYLFGGKGVNYERLNSHYLDDVWELRINQDIRFANKDTTDNIPNKSDIEYTFDWLQLKHLPYHQWPSRRAYFASTVVPFTMITHSDNSSSSSSSSSDIKYSDYLLIYGGETDIPFHKCSSNMKSQPNVPITTINNQDVETGNKKLLDDLWIFNPANENQLWINLLSSSDTDYDTTSDTYDKYNCKDQIKTSSTTTTPTAVTSPPLDIVGPLSLPRATTITTTIEAAEPKQQQQGQGQGQGQPGPRERSMLITLPITNKVLLFGGYGYSKAIMVDNNNNNNNNDNVGGNTDANHYSTDKNLNNLKSNLNKICSVDLYQIDDISAIINTAINNNNNNNNGGKSLWKRLADFNAPCLHGPAGVGIFDPADNQEKLFLFGGRYVTNMVQPSIVPVPNNNLPSTSSSSSSSSSSFSSRDTTIHHSTTTTTKEDNNEETMISREEYIFSSSIWMYILSSNTWEEIESPRTTGSGAGDQDQLWPPGRMYHSVTYVKERNSVFITGGLLENIINKGSIDEEDDDLENNQRGGGDTMHMDLWSFDLIARQWTCHDNGIHKHTSPSSSPESGTKTKGDETTGDTVNKGDYLHNNKQIIDLEMLYPDMRSHSSLSLIHLEASSIIGRWKVDNTISSTIPHLYLLIFGGKWLNYVKTKINPETNSKRKLSVHDNSNNSNSIRSIFQSIISTPISFLFGSISSVRSTMYGEDDSPATVVTIPEMNDLWLYKLPTTSTTTTTSSTTTTTATTSTTTDGNNNNNRDMNKDSILQDIFIKKVTTQSKEAITITDDRPEKEAWIYLSIGGCHAFDDGHQREPLDIAALLILIALAISLLFGLCFYRTLRPIMTDFRARYRGYSNLSDSDGSLFNVC